MTSSPTAQAAGSKRAHEPDEPQADVAQHNPVSPTQRGGAGPSASTANFRNVSACNRCRLRKNRCDQRLPACTACEKAHQRCVGFDPITKQEIPRSYVYYLESRVSYCESLLTANNISFESGDAFDDGALRGQGVAQSARVVPIAKSKINTTQQPPQSDNKDGGEKTKETERLNEIVNDIGMITVHGASDRRYLGSTSGISFARVVLAAVKSSMAASSSERTGTRPSQPPALMTPGGSSMRDSYFGLSTKSTVKEAPFPDRKLGDKLVRLYFEHANPQIPTLHREEFMDVYNHAYSVEPRDRTPRELYLLNIVFAIGAGIIFGSSESSSDNLDDPHTSPKRARLSGMPQAQPEEYHAAAIIHLSSFLSSSSVTEGQGKSGGDLEDLQAVLLLAGFALLRPVAPGLWYIVGVAMRLAVDLGLHFEAGQDPDSKQDASEVMTHQRRPSYFVMNVKDKGKREWMRDLRRRLWWCTYSFDRLVSTCVGRPFGVTDVVVTTEFPSMLDDKYITREGIKRPTSSNEPSYKHVTYHYVRLRLLQSEILQVLQYQQAQQARSRGVNRKNVWVHKDAPSPFLIKHQDFRSWRRDMDQRLWEWKQSAPTKAQTGVEFSLQFLELNYWQAVIVLYRNSLSVPEELAKVTSPTEEVTSPTSPPAESEEDQDIVFLKCAEAGQKTLKLYRQLHRQRLVNYTYLSTHHLFMAGISFLYAIWHSPVVRRHMTLDDFDFTVLAATSVLGDLMTVCPPAESCRDAFERMSKATVQMCMSTPGFGFGPQDQIGQFPFPQGSTTSAPFGVDSTVKQENYRSMQEPASRKRPVPKFDMNLRDLFHEDIGNHVRPSRSIPQPTINPQRPRHPQQDFSGGNNISMPGPTGQSAQSLSNVDPLRPAGEDFSPSIQQQQVSRMLANPSTQPLGPQYMDINQNTYNPDFMSNLPGLDFLNSLTRNPGMEPFGGAPMRNASLNTSRTMASPQGQMIPDDAASTIDHPFDSTTSDTAMDYGAYEYSPAFSFGDHTDFDYDFDFNQQHDWGNGQNGFDLFNGFFFDRNGT